MNNVQSKGPKEIKRTRFPIAAIILLGLVVTGVFGAKPFMEYLTAQAANPSGFVGGMITKIWSNYFTDLYAWGLTHVDLNSGDTILDVGFGGGSGIKYLLEQNGADRIYGIDVSKESLKTATGINQSAVDAGRVLLSLGDVAQMDFENASFDIVIAAQSHIYWEELHEGLKECYRTLNTGGRFLVLCEIDKIEYHLPEYANATDFVQLLYDNGFTNVSTATHGNYIAFIATI